jgi:C4-dicarboxylate transporter DctM subunit
MMDPLLLGALVAFFTIFVLFSGVSVALGLLIVSAGFLIIFDGMRSLELMPEILFGKLDNFALLSIPMFIIMGASIASTRAGADLYEALERWLTRVPGGLVVSNLGACACLPRCPGPVRQLVRLSARWAFRKCASAAIRTALRPDRSPLAARSVS